MLRLADGCVSFVGVQLAAGDGASAVETLERMLCLLVLAKFYQPAADEADDAPPMNAFERAFGDNAVVSDHHSPCSRHGLWSLVVALITSGLWPQEGAAEFDSEDFDAEVFVCEEVEPLVAELVDAYAALATEPATVGKPAGRTLLRRAEALAVRP